MEAKQEQKIRRSLEIIDLFNQSGVNYRILGSLLIAAMNGKPYRQIGDVDIILDVKDKQRVFDLLRKKKFRITHEKAYGFSWIEASHPNYITFSFTLVGTFHKAYFSYPIGKHSELTITNEYLEPYEYELYGKTFVGIPPKSVYEGIKISDLNPKRKKDKEILARILPTKLRGLSISQAT